MFYDFTATQAYDGAFIQFMNTIWVEKPGDKLADLLTKPNTWQGMGCGRRSCMLCWTKQKTQKNMSQDCHTRNLVYQTWCISCQTRDEEKVEQEYEGDAKKIKEMKHKIKMHL